MELKIVESADPNDIAAGLGISPERANELKQAASDLGNPKVLTNRARDIAALCANEEEFAFLWAIDIMWMMVSNIIDPFGR